MKEQREWIPYSDLDWDDKKFNVFSIDTRDFHAGYRHEKKQHEDLDTLSKYPDFFHTKEEVIELMDRYYTESGGEQEWRFFNLVGIQNWNMKYIRIWRSNLGFIVCNSGNRAMKKDLLGNKVDKQY